MKEETTPIPPKVGDVVLFELEEGGKVMSSTVVSTNVTPIGEIVSVDIDGQLNFLAPWRILNNLSPQTPVGIDCSDFFLDSSSSSAECEGPEAHLFCGFLFKDNLSEETYSAGPLNLMNAQNFSRHIV